MKKRTIILFLFVISLLLSGCAEKRRVYLRKPTKKRIIAKAMKAPKKIEAKPEVPEVLPPPGKVEEEKEAEYDYVEFKSAADLFFSAVEQYEAKEYDTAFILFDQIINIFPDDSLVEDAILYQARMLFIKKFYKRAAKQYDNVLRNFPDTRFKEEVSFYVYLCYRELEQDDDAASQLDEFIASFPQSKYLVEINLEKGMKYYKHMELLKAIDYYVKYYNVSNDDEMKEYVKGKAIRIIDDLLSLEKLERIADLYYDKFPAADINLSLAKAYIKARDPGSARVTLLEIQEFYPLFDKYDEVIETLELLDLRGKTKPNVIACLLPLSGKYEAYGKRLLAGILLAADVFSEGEVESPFTIMVKDTKGDPDISLEMLEEAYSSDQAIAVIGPLLSKNAQVCAERAEQLKLPIMLLTQKEKVTEGYEYVYRKFITNSKQVNSLLDYAMGYQQLRRFAIMYPANTFGNELHEIFFNEVVRRGGQIVATEPYDTKSNDFTYFIKRLVGLDNLTDRKRLRELLVDEVIEEEQLDMQYMIDNERMTRKEVDEYIDTLREELMAEEYDPVVDFEAIFVPDSYSRAGLIIPQLLYHDIDNDVLKLGTSGYNSKKLIDIARANANGIVFVDGFFKDSNAERVKAFLKECEETFQTVPTLLEAEAYDSTKIIIGLLKEQKLIGRDELKNALDAIRDYEGITGLVKSFKNGDADEDLVMLRVVRERIRQIPKAELGTALNENGSKETNSNEGIAE